MIPSVKYASRISQIQEMLRKKNAQGEFLKSKYIIALRSFTSIFVYGRKSVERGLLKSVLFLS